MGDRAVIAVLVGIVAGLAGYYTYLQSGSVISALLVTLASGWLFHRFSSGERAWNTFGFLLNPATSALLFFLAGFSYLAIQGSPFGIALIVALGLAFIGAVIAMISSNYW